MSQIHRLLCLLLVASPVAGCYEASAPAEAPTEYRPDLYQGRAVFFDDSALPFTYVGDTVSFVPPGTPEFQALVAHYQQDPTTYRRWAISHAHSSTVTDREPHEINTHHAMERRTKSD